MNTQAPPSITRRVVAAIATTLAVLFLFLVALGAVAAYFLDMLAAELAPLLQGWTIG